MTTDETAARRAAITSLLRRRAVATQEELRALLARAGHAVTQATLSRDLARLGARRAARPGGGTSYELPGGAGSALVADRPGDRPGDRLGELADLVVDLDDNGQLVIVRTTPGAASAVALALDHAQLPGVLGTLAGDDTIFVAPARGMATAKVAVRLRQLFHRGPRI
jgi:transcriptional regulator of arginine metabolism